MTNLKYVNLVLENCDHIHIPGKYVKDIVIKNITKNGWGANLWSKSKGEENDGWYEESRTVESFSISIDKAFLDNSFISFGHYKESYSILERLQKWLDLTQIEIINRNRGCKYFGSLFGKPIKITWPKKSTRYHYHLPWYFGADSKDLRWFDTTWINSEGKVMRCSDSNKYLSIKIEEDVVTIVVEKS